MRVALGSFHEDCESMRNIPKPSQRTSFVFVRDIGSDKIVEGTVILESLVAVIGGVYTPGDSIAGEYGDVS